MDEGVRLQRNTAKLLAFYLFIVVTGAGGWLAATWGEAQGRYTNTGPFRVCAAIFFICGIAALGSLLWSFYIHVDEHGLTLRLRGATTRLSWESVELLTVEKAGEGWQDPRLTIRLVPGATIRGRIARKQDGRCTYELLGVEDFALPAEDVLAILRRYGKDRVDGRVYLGFREAVRRVTVFMAEREQATGESAERGGGDGPTG
ncbi:hypothetical protein [Micromonospora echinaurantiaca]|uniref:hypothetical protein n=1 Tax=Micromonospora echinaurantiaca TaxID=47857 RepID=UPI000B5B032E|nr:hypothetical protein [Micromonospora echinaurantiaca]